MSEVPCTILLLRSSDSLGAGSSFFFFTTPEPRVEWYTTFKSLEYEPASEPLRISVK